MYDMCTTETFGTFDCSRQASEMFHASQSALKDATDYVASFAPRFAYGMGYPM